MKSHCCQHTARSRRDVAPHTARNHCPPPLTALLLGLERYTVRESLDNFITFNAIKCTTAIMTTNLMLTLRTTLMIRLSSSDDSSWSSTLFGDNWDVDELDNGIDNEDDLMEPASLPAFRPDSVCRLIENRGIAGDTDEHIARLDALGFNWTSQEYVTRSFDERIEDLEEYKRTHGHLYVKIHEDNILSQFCTNIRYSLTQFEKDGTRKLMGERIKRLDDIGFRWS